MGDLRVPDGSEEPVTVRSLKTSLRQGFKPTRDKDCMKVVELATYLLCLNEHEQCSVLLDSFLGFEVNREREDLWASFGMAAVLRAYLHHLAGEEEARLDRIKLVYDDDIVSSGVSRKEKIALTQEDYERFLRTHDETGRRDQQRSFSYLFMKYVYSHEITRLDPGDATEVDRRNIAGVLKRIKAQLLSVLRPGPVRKVAIAQL